MAMKKRLAQTLWDFFAAPLRLLLLRDEHALRLGLTTKQAERLEAVLPLIEGRLLDLGAGTNELVRRYGNGIGVDVRDWGGGALIVEDTSRLTFDAASFDTVTFLACLNHIPNREGALREAFRVLRPGGRLIITMIGPLLGGIGHRVWWFGGQPHRIENEGELPGLTNRHVMELLEAANFHICFRRRFVYGMNNLFVARKPLESEIADQKKRHGEQS